jgi:hypothetical protein
MINPHKPTHQSLIGTRRHTLNPILLLVSLITIYTSYTLYGGANGSEWTTVLGALGVVVLDAGRRWAGLGAVRGNLGVGVSLQGWAIERGDDPERKRWADIDIE